MAEALTVVATAVVSEVESQVTSQVAESLIGSVKREISYVFKYKSYIDDVEDKVTKMKHLRQRVEQAVEHADRQGEEIFEDVKVWLIGVEHFTESIAKPIIEDGDDGLCPNLLKRYRLSKKAVKAAEEGGNLLRNGNNFSPVSFPPAPERRVPKLGRGYLDFDSRKSIFQEIMEVLKDSNNDTIGVYGPGGVGKTTLVNRVARQGLEDKLFDEVVMAEVTQKPDLKTIQNKIASDLGLEFKQQENMFQRAEQLRQRLRKVKRVLVILDNIWEKLVLDDVGIPYGDDETDRKDDNTQCTVLLTSRSRDLLCRDMNSQKNFFIEVLSKEEAGQLFEKIAGDSAKQSDFQPIAEQIVGRCGGLPVAVNTIANALKNKSLPIWKDALDQLRNSNSREIHGMDANVYSSIELSYNFLGSDEAKSLFLLCSLYRQSESINVSYLLRYGMGLGLFKRVSTLETAWNRVRTLIDDLKASCLLLDGDAENWVKLHDVIYDVAVSIAEEKLMLNIPNTVDLKKEKVKIFQKGAIAISLPYGNQELPERLECPKLELFLFFEKRESSMQISDQFFEGMEKLKVLDFTGICFPSLPSSFGCLINLQTLGLDGCQLKDIAIIGQLKDLEILSFRDSDIKQLPVEIGQLVLLRLLDLSNCRRLKVIAPKVISKLSRLEELYMYNSFTQWEEIEGGSNNASVVELKELSKLTTLEICIKDAQVVRQDLGFEKLERYSILIGGVWHLSGIHETSRLMKLRGLEKSILLGHGMKMLLKRTKDLHLEELKGFQNVVHEIVSSVGVFPLLESLSLCNLVNLEKLCHGQLAKDQSFSNLTKMIVKRCHRLKYMFSYSMVNSLVRLQHLEINECDSIEGVVDTTGLGRDDEKVVFTKLHYMHLSGLPKLRSFAIAMGIHLSEDNIHIETQPQPLFDEKVQLPNLEILNIGGTKNLREIWHPQLASDSFNKLKDLRISSCDALINIFPSMVQLPNLEILYIGGTKNLREIWHHQLASDSFNKLKDLRISSCDALINIFPPMVRLPNLKELSIYNCNKLRNIFPSNMIMGRRFERLEELIVIKCESIEEIIEETSSNCNDSMIEVGEVRNDHIVFSQLKHFRLDNLPSLQSFCSGNYTLEFPSLEEVEIGRCPSMKTFSPAVLCTPKLNKVKRREYVDWAIWDGNLNSTVQKIFKEMYGFCDILSLKLSKFPHLKEIWHNQTLPVSFFSELKWLVVDDCNFFSSAISANLIPFLKGLCYLEVRDCDSVEEVFHLEELNADEHYRPLLPLLIELKLSRLPKLLHLWKAYSQPKNVFQRLETLEISECNKLENLVLFSESFEHLITLKVSKCDGLINFLTLSTVKSLRRLKRMIITDCKKLEKILEHGGEEVEDCIFFCNLRYLQLDRLPSLTGFCLGNYTLKFPFLEIVVLRECPKMKTFSNGVLSTPKLHKVQVKEEDEDKGDGNEGRWEGNLNSTIQQFFKEMNAQSSTQE